VRPAVKANGFDYYEVVLCYVDDMLSISDNPKATLLDLTAVFKLKDEKIEPPDMYLGAQLDKMIIAGAECWTMSAEKYVTEVVSVCDY
jgi:hypothetical protein